MPEDSVRNEIHMSETNVKNEIQMPVPVGPLPTLPSKGNMARLQGNRIAVSIFFDQYKNQAAGLDAIRGDAENIKRVLEDKLKFRYKFPSESDPTLFEPHQFENQGKLVATFREFLEKWTERQPKGTVVDTFLLYVHGHGAQVLGEQCLFTNKWTAIPLRELVNLIAEYVRPIRYYVIMDCCSNTKIVDEKAKKRVDEAVSMQKPTDFEDRLIEVYAAPAGYTATAATGKTLTSALVAVLEDSRKKGEVGIPMMELEGRLIEKHYTQESTNKPSVRFRSKQVGRLFPL